MMVCFQICIFIDEQLVSDNYGIELYYHKSDILIDISYIYDVWTHDEYCASQIFTNNFSIPASQRIEGIAFMVNFTEIPQIEAMLFGQIQEDVPYKLLFYDLIKDEDLLTIELFNFDIGQWVKVPYVAYDLGDRDGSTFGYFIDRNVVEFLEYDGLLSDLYLYLALRANLKSMRLLYRYIITLATLLYRLTPL